MGISAGNAADGGVLLYIAGDDEAAVGGIV